MKEKNNDKKKYFKLIGFSLTGCLIVTCLFLALYFYLNPAEMKIEDTKSAEKYVEKFNVLILNGTNKERIKKILRYDIKDNLIMIGSDSYQRIKPSSRIIKKYNLEKYVKESKKLSDKLEDKIKNNFAVKVISCEQEKMFFVVKVSYKTFYYSDYISDLVTIEHELFSRLGFDYKENSNLTDLEKANKYKAKVKAMKILDDYLDDYVNKNEQKIFDLYLTNGKSSKSNNEMMAYLYHILGYNYEKFSHNFNERIMRYSKKIDNKNVLDL